MPDAKAIADKYISRGGGSPVPSKDETVGDLLAVASFILWHDDGHLMGGYRKEQAYDAFCRLLNVDRVALRKIIVGDPRHDG